MNPIFGKLLLGLWGLLWQGPAMQSNLLLLGEGRTAAAAGGCSSVVNTTTGSTTASVTSLAATAANHTTGNLIAVWIRLGQTGATVSSVTDTASNTYTNAEARITQANVGAGQWWYAKNITGNASNVVTANFSSSDFDALEVFQITGCTTSTPLDLGPAGVTSASATSLTSAAFTTAQANEVILFGANVGATGETFTVGLIGGTTATAVVHDSNSMSAAEYLAVTTVQTAQTAALSWNSAAAAMAAVVSFH